MIILKSSRPRDSPVDEIYARYTRDVREILAEVRDPRDSPTVIMSHGMVETRSSSSHDLQKFEVLKFQYN